MWYWDRWRLTVVLFILLSYLFTMFILRVFIWFLDFQMLHAACLIWHSCSFLNCINCLNCRRPADGGGVSTVIYLTLFSLSPSLFSQLLSLHRFFFPYIHPYPSSLPAALEPHCGIDRKTSSVSLRVLGGMCIMDQRFRCLLSPMGSNTALGPVCVYACISKSEAHETENLPHVSPCMSLKIRHLRFCLQTQHVN